MNKLKILICRFCIFERITFSPIVPRRLECTPIAFEYLDVDPNEDAEVYHKAKRFRPGPKSEEKGAVETSSIFEEVGYLAKSLNATWKKMQN